MKSLRQAIEKSWLPDMHVVRGDLASSLGLSVPLSLTELTRFFDQPEVFASSARYGAPIGVFGYHFNEPFTILGIQFGADSGFLLLTTALFGAVGLGVVALRRGAFRRSP